MCWRLGGKIGDTWAQYAHENNLNKYHEQNQGRLIFTSNY